MSQQPRPQGKFVDLAGERSYLICDVEQMSPFLISLVSSDDHWLFASSNGAVTAGRVSPDNALFPYVTVDKIHDSQGHTGSRTLLRVHDAADVHIWEPFSRDHGGRYAITRNLYKTVLGNKLSFEEINHDLKLRFRCTWMTSREYGFVRQCQLQYDGPGTLAVDLLDGLQNLLPAGTKLYAQTNVSNLVDAYKWNELYPESGLAILTLYSAITDRAEPAESLRATTVFCLGLKASTHLLSTAQIDGFKAGSALRAEALVRGVRGAYLPASSLELTGGAPVVWRMVANTEQSQKDVVALRRALQEPDQLSAAIDRSVAEGSDSLARTVASCDGFQLAAEEAVVVHHYANTLFNGMRGGVFFDQYSVPTEDFRRTVACSNREVHDRSRDFLLQLPDALPLEDLLARVSAHGDMQLLRLAREYLPLTFGRRHGDPSRPWNHFTIRLRDEDGSRLLSYEGNWRDIFQNWEALALAFPEMIESMIAKFVNASTRDGYNPYRITKEGIDWEVEEPDNPWSHIGYWGDHQIIYLLRLLELSVQYHPARLNQLLHTPLFSYANVPYRIRPFQAQLRDPKHTVDYDHNLAARIEQHVAAIGADGKLVRAPDGEVYQVTLLEKLLVPMLAKLANFVPGGGIWLNTQRPEWNDANNALVGHGLSVVTLCHMRRYVRLLAQLLESQGCAIVLSVEVSQWLSATSDAMRRLRKRLTAGRVDASLRFNSLKELGEAASHYRSSIYRIDGYSGTVEHSAETLQELLDDTAAALDHSITGNRRPDGLYHTYNLLELQPGMAEISRLYPMLEGQVAALDSGAVPAREAVRLLEALFASEMYRKDQHSFMLYPDRKLPAFLEKNRIDAGQLEGIPLLRCMLDRGDERIVLLDAEGCYRFHPGLQNARALREQLRALVPDYGDAVEGSEAAIEAVYESVFNHKRFTGRSGTMFAFEGLGSIYWHMVAKLLLATQEAFFRAREADESAELCQSLGVLYYSIRAGLGFNKQPGEYGAFPTDPYSHTPRHAGASQPGMTGQVKEEIITRFGELGLRVRGGKVCFEPALLRTQELLGQAGIFRHLAVDGSWQQIELAKNTLAFSWCQLPVIYGIGKARHPSLTLVLRDGSERRLPRNWLEHDESAEVFKRTGAIRRIELVFPEHSLFSGGATG
ncbi:MAG: hypothetical protein JJT85_00985 [Chromatiales bacterium]|nr:hypothetical protein [Chromatiales bacterium]